MSRRLRLLGFLLALAALAVAAPAAQAALPPIHHVYVIVLENESASTTFAPSSPAPYLSKSLRAEGAYLPNYYGIGHASNDNYIAMISGQAPNPDTQSDCRTFGNFPGTSIGAYGQEHGQGCVYPAAVPTLAGQLQSTGLSWRDYNDSMGADPAREAAVCGHPAVGSSDGTEAATPTDQYATRHNPFVYFHSIIDNTALCDTHVVSLRPLAQDLAKAKAPNYVFITPDLCNDGHDASCANGGPGGLPQADTFLRAWVPKITGSPAFTRDGGLLLILFDEAVGESTACCGEIPGPGSPTPGVSGPGGGDVGAVVLSPYVHAGTVSPRPYNHYSMLRSVEDLFGLAHLGYAQLPGQTSLGSDIFACAPARAPVPKHGRLPAGSEIERVAIAHRGRHVSLNLYSVGASALRVTVRSTSRRPHHPPTVVIKRTLAPCQTYSLALPTGSGRLVGVVASASGGGQTAALRY